jgi:hypothetical protein
VGTGGRVDHSRPSGDEVKNEWSNTSAPPYAFLTLRSTTLPSLVLNILCVKVKTFSFLHSP